MTYYPNILIDGKVQDFEYFKTERGVRLYRSNRRHILSERTLDTLLREQMKGKIGEGKAFYELDKVAERGGRHE